MTARVVTQRAPLSERLRLWLAGNPDDAILRAVFRIMLAVTFAVLAVDLATMNGWIPATPETRPDLTPAAPLPPAMPSLLPSLLAPLLPGERRQTPMPQPGGALAKSMTFELVGGNKLMATGTITPGIADAFAAEIARRGDYVKTVVLNSPGGSVADALAMGRLIRDKKLATEVEAGKYCASSCPLMFVGGVTRTAGDKSAIGVHQVFAAPSPDPVAPRDEMSDGQRISARCQRYLAEMGINLQVWVHAMETPKDRLFIFKPDELASLNVVTPPAAPAASPAPAAAPTPAPKKS